MPPPDKLPVPRDGQAPPVTQPAAQQSLALVLPPELPWRKDPPVYASRSRVTPLWLCIHFPSLPLEALNARDGAVTEAVFENQQGNRRILMADARAVELGITPGQFASHSA